MQSWKYYIETYGCKINQYESEKLRESFRCRGGTETDDPGEADYIIINSCAITSRAERDSRNAVYRARKHAPASQIILSGCAAQLYEDFKPRKNAPCAQPDLIIRQTEKPELLKCSFLKPEECAEVESGGQAVSWTRNRPVIKIQDGCSQNCAYCIVPQTRGRPVSRAPEDIISECRQLLLNGYSELMLSGINLRLYGKDRPEYGNFWDLLAMLENELAPEWSGKARLRISSLDPAVLSDRGIELLGQSQLICPHLHLSLQHASPEILKRMGRRYYKLESIKMNIEKLRAYWPVMGIGADIIVGFPGETETDLQKLLLVMEELGLTYAHVFPFSARPGTLAPTMTCQISKKEKQERAKIVRNKAQNLKRAFLNRLLSIPDMKITLDNDEGARGFVKGVNEYYAQCKIKSTGYEKGLIKAQPVGVEDDCLIALKI